MSKKKKRTVLIGSYTETQTGPTGKLDYHSDGNIMCPKLYWVSVALYKGAQSASRVLYHLSSQDSCNVGRGQP